jgi:hypothetical protein
MPAVIRFLPGFVVFVFWLFCLIEVITSRPASVRNLSKNIWLLIVFFFPVIGSIAWLIAGRPAAGRRLTREQAAAAGSPEHERRGRFSAADPKKDEEFLKRVRERAEEQRWLHEQKKREEREAQEAQEAQPDEDTDPDPVP